MHAESTLQARMRGEDMINQISNRHLKILVVDDDKEFRESMGFMLSRKYDAFVKEVGSGSKAIEAVKEDQGFDVVFVDLGMPEMNGLQTLRLLRDVQPSCNVVLMSAHSDSGEWAEAEKLGIELISKPYPGNIITKILYHAMRR